MKQFLLTVGILYSVRWEHFQPKPYRNMYVYWLPLVKKSYKSHRFCPQIYLALQKRKSLHKSLPILVPGIWTARVKILLISGLSRAKQPERIVLHITHLKTDLWKIFLNEWRSITFPMYLLYYHATWSRFLNGPQLCSPSKVWEQMSDLNVWFVNTGLVCIVLLQIR